MTQMRLLPVWAGCVHLQSHRLRLFRQIVQEMEIGIRSTARFSFVGLVSKRPRPSSVGGKDGGMISRDAWRG